MKLKAHVDETDHDLEIVNDNGALAARVSDREYQLNASEPQPGIFLLKGLDGRVFEAAVTTAVDGAMSVRIAGHDIDVRITDPKRLRGAGSDAEQASGRAEIKTAMPGKIVRIVQAVGAEVQKG